jgi:hypothetical protein
MTGKKPPSYGWPKSAAHERIDLGKSLPLKHDRFGRPFSRTIAKNEAAKLCLVGVERFGEA